jgi:hypothetical protein
MKSSTPLKAILTGSFSFALCLFISYAHAQGNPFWSNAGNGVSSSDFLGTNNSQPLIFKTNGTERARFDAGGDFHLKGLEGPGAGLLFSDNTGKVLRVNLTGSSMDILSGNGTFTNISNVSGFKNAGGYVASVPGYNVGIGTSTPTAALEVSGTTKLNGNATVSNTLIVNGQLNFAGAGVKYTPSSSTSPAYLVFGSLTGPINININPAFPACISAPVQTVNAFQGILQSYGLDASGAQGAMTMGFDGANGLIDLAGAVGGSVPSRLLLNYYCGKDIYMCSGTDKGFVVVGQNLEIGSVPRDVNTSLRVSGDLTNAITVSKATYDPFQVQANGSVTINVSDVNTMPNAFQVYDLTSQKANFIVKSNGNVYCRKVNVTLNNFPDYVFENGYRLRPLEEVSSYVAANKHLPGMPAASSVEKDGADLGELSRLSVEKVEELYLYIIELNKQVKELQAQLAELKE